MGWLSGSNCESQYIQVSICERLHMLTAHEHHKETFAEEHLQGLAEWQQPKAGMFAWMKLCGGIKDADQILDKLKEEKVVVVPG